MKQGKVWGTTETVFKNGFIEVHFLEIKKGGFCSEHIHKHKTNRFYVISGKLKIYVWNEDHIRDEVILRDGQSTIIPPGVYHKFEGMEKTTCIEIYEVKFYDADIERRTIGGIKE